MKVIIQSIIRSKCSSFIFFCILFIFLAWMYRTPAWGGGEPSQYSIKAERWKDAEKIFHSDPRWLGGDGATSMDLGCGRVLWLFGDSFVDPSGSGLRRTSDLVRNSIAVQSGDDPTRAKMEFFWKMKDEKPAAFFECKSDHWFWPASGIMVGRNLVIFLMEVKPAGNELGFEACGWKGVLVNNPQDSPDQWIITYLISPQKDGLVVGSSNPVLEKEFMYVFATDGKNNAVYLVRWPKRLACAGILTKPQWWAGNTKGWAGPKAAGAKLCSIISDGQMEFSVEYVPQLKRYLQVQTLSIINPCIAMSTSTRLTGPWSKHSCFFPPPEQKMAGALIYAGKSHPMLDGGNMVFSYIVNTTDEGKLLQDMSIYFPIMVKGTINPGCAIP